MTTIHKELSRAVENGIEAELLKRWRDPEFAFHYETTYWYGILADYEVICTQDTEIVFGDDGIGYDFAIPNSYTVKVARTFNCPFARKTFKGYRLDIKEHACKWLAGIIEEDWRDRK